MKTVIFNGKKEAEKIIFDLALNVSELRKKKIVPNLVSIMIGDDKASKLYLSIKKRVAEKVGAKVEITQFDEGTSIDQIIKFIQRQNGDSSVHGIMIQLPLPKSYSEADENTIIHTISRAKDVDGMKPDSEYITPVVKAIEIARKKGLKIVRLSDKNNLSQMKLPQAYGSTSLTILNLSKDARGIFSACSGSKILPKQKTLRIHPRSNRGILRRRIKSFLCKKPKEKPVR